MLHHRISLARPLRTVRLLAATGAIALLAACSTLDRGQPPQLERKASWVVLPFANHTKTPLAGQRAEAIAQALLSAQEWEVTEACQSFGGFWIDMRESDTFAQFVVQQHVGAVGNHLVAIHVSVRSRPGLPDNQRELIIELPFRNFIAHLRN